MDALRLSLIIAGALVIGGVYLWTSHLQYKKQQQKTGRDTHDGDIAPTVALDNSGFIPDQDEHGFTAQPESELDVDKLYTHDVARERISFPDSDEINSLSDVIEENKSNDVYDTNENTPQVFIKPQVYTSKLDQTKSHIKAVHERERLQSKQSRETKPQGLVIVINLLARPGLDFKGEKVVQALKQAGLEPGDMDIFHYYSMTENQSREKIFSLANLVNPGTFDVDNISSFNTPGFSLFMQLPGPINGLKIFEIMLSTSQFLKKQLDGELCDESRSALTYQTISHLKERVKEYSFKYQQD